MSLAFAQPSGRGIKFDAFPFVETNSSFAGSVVQMGDSFGNSEKSMHVVIERIGEQLLRKVKGSDSRRWYEARYLALSIVDRSNIAMEYFIKIGYRFPVSAICKCRRETSEAGEADEIFRQRSKPTAGIDRIG